jgi:hypothetical protein
MHHLPIANPLSRRVATAIGIVLAALTLTVGRGQAATASPGTTPGCVSKTFKVYPGSTLGRVRYGRADFNFQLCGGDAGNSFKTRASVMTNATGENFGFFVSNPQVVATDVFANAAIFVASFHSKTCTPRLGWPCLGSGDWKVKYGVSSMTERPRAAPVPDVTFVEFSRSTPDLAYTLYNTP